MRELPILFNAPMVRAIQDGTKTQTRRVVKPQPPWRDDGTDAVFPHGEGWRYSDCVYPSDDDCMSCPYGQAGDRLWVRETMRYLPPANGDRLGPLVYAADGAEFPGRTGTARTVPSIHMPRWASRITLEVTGVRIERLQAISELDARAEGAHIHDGRGIGHSGWRHDDGAVHADARSAFARLWESLNGAGSWDANPWVWVISFRRVDSVKESRDG